MDLKRCEYSGAMSCPVKMATDFLSDRAGKVVFPEPVKLLMIRFVQLVIKLHEPSTRIAFASLSLFKWRKP